MSGIIFKPLTKTQEEYDKITMDTYIKDQRNLEALERLLKNNDFKLLILEGFFEEYPLGKIKTSTSTMLDPAIRDLAFEQAKAPVHLAQYFNGIEEKGKDAREVLANHIRTERG